MSKHQKEARAAEVLVELRRAEEALGATRVHVIAAGAGDLPEPAAQDELEQLLTRAAELIRQQRRAATEAEGA